MQHSIIIPIRNAGELQWWIERGPFFGYRNRFAVTFRNDADAHFPFESVAEGDDGGTEIVAVQLVPCVFGDDK